MIATIGGNYQGDIAIDDIVMNKCKPCEWYICDIFFDF